MLAAMQRRKAPYRTSIINFTVIGFKFTQKERHSSRALKVI